MRDDHHLADSEIRVLLAIAGKRPPLRWSAQWKQAIEALMQFGLAKEEMDGGYMLTSEGRELADALAPSSG